MTQQRGLYLYAVVGFDTSASPALAGDILGVDDTAVATIEQDGLGAVVSEVDLEQLAAVVDGAEPDLLTGLAQRHHAVVLAAMDAVDRVLPLRLGTVLTGPDAARQFLDRRAGELSDGLREVDACREWGITIGQTDDAIPTAAAAEGGAGSDVGVGTAYLRRRREQIDEAQRRRAAQADVAAAVADAVRATAVRAAPGPRSAGGVLLDESYLVRRGSEDRFLTVVDDCGSQLRERGLRLRLTGPWPPYSFVPSTLRVVT
jgi:hypothetical protein